MRDALWAALAVLAVAAYVGFFVWIGLTADDTYKVAECPEGYEYVNKEGFGSRSKCVSADGRLAIPPTWREVPAGEAP